MVVTGAAGFIASHTCEALLSQGHAVIGLDSLDPFYDPQLKRQNLHELSTAFPGLFSFVHTDICDRDALARVFSEHRPRAVIHLAAKAGVRPSIADPPAYARANVLGTASLLDAAAAHGCERFIMASSSSVYGNCPQAPFHEELDVSRPISPYAATKRACELIAHSHHHLTGMPTACLRFFTVFGPRQRPDLAINAFLRRVSRGEPIDVFGDGSSSRDYTFVADTVSGILSALARIDTFGYRVWNLGNSTPITLSDMVATIGRVVGREPIINRKPMQPGDVDRTWADLTRARAELGYQPTTPFEEGVRRQWEWMQRP